MDFPSQVGDEPPEEIDLSDQALQLLFSSFLGEWDPGSLLPTLIHGAGSREGCLII